MDGKRSKFDFWTIVSLKTLKTLLYIDLVRSKFPPPWLDLNWEILYGTRFLLYVLLFIRDGKIDS